MAETWIKETGQQWKLYVFGLIAGIGVAFFVGFVAELRQETSSQNTLWTVGFILFTLIALGWLCTSVRCNNCHGRPAWWVVRHADAREWFVLLLSMPQCPICGVGPNGNAPKA